jgi:hypothetical protein
MDQALHKRLQTALQERGGSHARAGSGAIRAAPCMQVLYISCNHDSCDDSAIQSVRLRHTSMHSMLSGSLGEAV